MKREHSGIGNVPRLGTQLCQVAAEGSNPFARSKCPQRKSECYLLTETDGPFTQVDSRPSEPADVKTTVAAIADVRRVPVDAVTTAVRSNLRSLLK